MPQISSTKLIWVLCLWNREGLATTDWFLAGIWQRLGGNFLFEYVVVNGEEKLFLRFSL
jgi:hypothetical protein